MRTVLAFLFLIATPAWADQPPWAHDVKKRVTKSEDFEEVVVEVNGVQAGYRYDHGKRFDLKWERDPKTLGLTHRLRAHEITKAFPPEADPLELPAGAVPDAMPPAAPDAATSIVIDVNYFYTAAAEAKIGTANLPAFMALSCSLATQTYANSGMANVTVRCFGPFKASYPDTTTLNDALTWMGTTGAGASEIAAKYAMTGADMSHMIIAVAGGKCGLGWLTASASNALSTSDQSCANSNLSFPHEAVGHNVGMHHDPTNAGCTATSPTTGLPYCSGSYNYGHSWPIGAPKWRTVMAYPGAGGTRITQWSNPSVLYQGYPTGVVNERDNAKVAVARAPVVSAFRTATTTTHRPPANGTNFQIVP